MGLHQFYDLGHIGYIDFLRLERKPRFFAASGADNVKAGFVEQDPDQRSNFSQS